jgi:hypothetical protein
MKGMATTTLLLLAAREQSLQLRQVNASNSPHDALILDFLDLSHKKSVLPD